MAIRRVVPAILTKDAPTLERLTRQAGSFTSWVQYDIMDGLFVPSQSVDSSEIAAVKPDFEYDAHLMMRHPEAYFQAFRLAGARRITFHLEACSVPDEWLSYLKNLGLEAGLAINPDTPATEITGAIAAQTDIVLLLSVHPGYYGRPFIPAVLDKAKELRREYPNLRLGMDGGIKAENITQVAEAGVDEICVGSAIFAAPDPAEAYHNLENLASQGWEHYCENH